MDALAIGGLIAVGTTIINAAVAEIRQALQEPRDEAKRAAQWKRKDELRHEAARLAAYETFGASINAVVMRAKRAADKPHLVPADPYEVVEAMNLARARVRLVGSPETSAEADALASEAMFLLMAAEGNHGQPLRLDEVRRVAKQTDAFYEAARRDIGQPTRRPPARTAAAAESDARSVVPRGPGNEPA